MKIIQNRERVRPRKSSARNFLSALATTMVALILTLAFQPAQSNAAPEPSPRPPRWELQFKTVHQLRLLKIDDSFYWFMTYLISNRTGEDQTFVPNATLYTDAGDIIPDGNVGFRIVDQILELLNNPLLESKNQIIGPLLQGKENAKEGLLIWKARSLDIDHVSVFIAGLSSETQVALNPYNGNEYVVRKTLALEYDVPGEPAANIRSPVRYVDKRWIMR